MKSVFVVCAMVASLMIIGCGKKKESVSNEPAPPQATPENSGNQPATKPDSEKPDQTKPEPKKDDLKPKIEAPKDGSKKSAASKGKVKGKGQANKPKKETAPEKPSQAELSGIQLTGAQSINGLLFTGTSDDGLLAQMIRDQQTKYAENSKMSFIFASTIWEAAYLIDRDGFLNIEIQFLKGDSFSKTEVKMPFESNQIMSISAQSAVGQSLVVQAKCLDYYAHASKCSNLLVTLNQKGAVASMILRQTMANIDYVHQKIESENEYASFVHFFKNAEDNVASGNKLQSAYLHTYEVANGKSGFKAILTGNQGQVIAFKADLLIKKSAQPAGINVIRETDFKSVDLWMGRTVSLDLGFSNLISSAVLSNNDGKGTITIDVSVDSKSTGSKNKLAIKFTRKTVKSSF